MSHTILIADDESAIRETLSAYLRQEGYQVITARDGQEAVAAFRHHKPDALILDVRMPQMDGWQVARLIRKESAVPLLFLTARVDDVDQIMGLELGADDYLTKPFSPRLVLARLRALLRRAYGELAQEARLWRVGQLVLDADSHQVTEGDRKLELTPSEFSLLQVLIARPGRVFTRLELLEQVQGEAYAGYERTIDVHIKNLRIKLEADPRNPRYVETVYGVGYRMRPDDE